MDFQERFRGRTTLVNKEGLVDTLNINSVPIQKVHEPQKESTNKPTPPPKSNIHYKSLFIKTSD